MFQSRFAAPYGAAIFNSVPVCSGRRCEMTTNVERPASAPQPGQPVWRRFLSWPGTRLGWWAVGLAAAFEIMMLFSGAVLMQRTEEVQGWQQLLLILYGFAMMACGLAYGITALVALL